MAAQPVIFTTMNQAEELWQARPANQRGADQFVLQVHEKTSLLNAAEIKNNTRAGCAGFEVLNPELLDCKSRTTTKLLRAHKSFLDNCMMEYDEHILAIDAHIAALLRNIAIPDNQMQHHGPPAEERNRGVRQGLYLPPTYEEFHSYEYPARDIPFREPFNTDPIRGQAIARDRHSQKAWWNLNLTYLEKKRKILEEQRVKLERELRTVLETAMESESYLGSGYADYTFLYL